MAGSVFKARGMPRGNTVNLKLANGRKVKAFNNAGTRIPPNASVTVVFEDGKYNVIGFDR